MAWFCTQCGNEIKPGSKFCNKCGYAVDNTVLLNNEEKADKYNNISAIINGLGSLKDCYLAFLEKQTGIKKALVILMTFFTVLGLVNTIYIAGDSLLLAVSSPDSSPKALTNSYAKFVETFYNNGFRNKSLKELENQFLRFWPESKKRDADYYFSELFDSKKDVDALPDSKVAYLISNRPISKDNLIYYTIAFVEDSIIKKVARDKFATRLFFEHRLIIKKQDNGNYAIEKLGWDIKPRNPNVYSW